MYAIVKTGGKQYRVEQGQSLLVERLPVAEGDAVSLAPLLYVDDSQVVDQVDGLASVTVEARVVGHERGPKLRIVKFKPKRGYKRRTGHRQDLTRIEIVSVKLAGGRGRSGGRGKSEGAEDGATGASARAAKSEAPAAAKSEAPAAVKSEAPAAVKSEAAAAGKSEAPAAGKSDAPAPETTEAPAPERPESQTSAPEEAGNGT